MWSMSNASAGVTVAAPHEAELPAASWLVFELVQHKGN